MKKLKRITALLLICILAFSSIQVNAAESDQDLYEKMIEAYLDGNEMDAWVVQARKDIAKELGLSEYLDEKSFLSVEYRNENKIGRRGIEEDERINVLIEMATKEEEMMILLKGMVQTLSARSVVTGDTVGVTQESRVNGADNGYFTVSDADSYGFCAQNSKDYWSNHTTKWAYVSEWDNAEARKALYYGPGGPGYAGPYYGSLGEDMDYVTFTVGQLNGDSNNNTKAYAYRNYLEDKTDPITYGYKAFKADVDEPYQDVAFLSYAPMEGNLIIKKGSARTIDSNAASYYSYENAVFEIYQEASCQTKLGTLKTGKNGLSDSITLMEGTYYVKEVTAPLGFILNTVIMPVDVVGGTTTTETYNNIPNGTFILRKASARPDLTENNSCYSLEGAEYSIYYDEACTKLWKTVTTNSKGVTEPIYGYEGNYYVKETKAPKGYALDKKIYFITLNFGKVTYLDVTDKVQMDPVGVLLGKVDAETNANKPQGSASLEKAQFTMKFYGVLLDDKTIDPATLGYEPLRTWVFETDEDGYCVYGNECLIAGDELYFSPSGIPSLPIGTLTIQETKAPIGYHINPEVFVRQVNSEGHEESVETYNQPIILEKSLQMKVIKKTVIGDTESLLPGAEFVHIKPDGTSETFTTNENGELIIHGLQPGEHTVYETEAPAGFYLNDNIIKFSVSNLNKITFTNTADIDSTVNYRVDEGDNGEVVYYDKMFPVNVKINKVNEKGTLLDGATFRLWESGESSFKGQTATTQNGTLIFENLEPGKTYYFEETKAPEGYAVPTETYEKEDEYGETEIVTQRHIYQLKVGYQNGVGVLVQCENNPYWTDNNTTSGKEFIHAGETFKSASCSVDDKNVIVEFDILNTAGTFLPNTGSNKMIPITIIASLMMLFGIYIAFKRKKQKAFVLRNHSAKYFSLFLAIVVCLTSISVTDVNAYSKESVSGVIDFDNSSNTGKITICENDGQSLVGKEFNLYPLFYVESSQDKLSVKYRLNTEFESGLLDAYTQITGKTDIYSEEEILFYIQNLKGDALREYMETLRDILLDMDDSYYYTAQVSNTKEDNSIEIIGIEEGYYLIDEVTDIQGKEAANSLCIVDTVVEKTVQIKSDYPQVTKKIKEDDNNVGWNDMADYEIGQTVPYQITSNVPDINGYSTYYYAWHDVMDQALSFQKNSVELVVSDGTKEYEVTPSEYVLTENQDNTTFKVEIADLKTIVDREFPNQDAEGNNVYGQTITLRYNAILNENASKDTGRPGFENDVRLEFSNDPDSNGVGKTGFTAWDTVVCFTYKLKISKVNSSGKSLENVKFRIYSDKECTKELIIKETNNGYVNLYQNNTNQTESAELVTDSKGEIIISGLDEGIYYLKETEALENYKKLENPVEIHLKPSFVSDRNSYVKGNGATDKALSDLKFQASIKDENNTVLQELDLKVDLNEGMGNVTVVNRMGSKLPITGSAGTILLLGVGCTLIGTVLITAKRKRERETF